MTWSPPLADLVQRAAALRLDGRRVLLGIAGAPGAGKSTLAAELAAALGSAAVVGMDGFHFDDVTLRAAGSWERKGAPDTFDAAGYVALLRRLRSDPGPVRAPAFDRAAEATIPDAVVVAPDTIVITEGNNLLCTAPPWDDVRPLLDACWFVTGDEAHRQRRLIERFVSYGWDRDVATARVLRGSDAANAALVAPTIARADLVVRLNELRPAT